MPSNVGKPWLTPYRQGWNAYKAGRSLTACPNANGTPERDAWLDGYFASQAETEAAQDEPDAHDDAAQRADDNWSEPEEDNDE